MEGEEGRASLQCLASGALVPLADSQTSIVGSGLGSSSCPNSSVNISALPRTVSHSQGQQTQPVNRQQLASTDQLPPMNQLTDTQSTSPVETLYHNICPGCSDGRTDQPDASSLWEPLDAVAHWRSRLRVLQSILGDSGRPGGGAGVAACAAETLMTLQSIPAASDVASVGWPLLLATCTTAGAVASARLVGATGAGALARLSLHLLPLVFPGFPANPRGSVL